MSKLIDSFSKTGTQIADATKGMFGNKDAAQAALDSVTTVTKERGPVRQAASTVAGWGVRGVTKPFRMAFNGVAYVATRPLVWGESLASKGVSSYGNAFAKNPKTVLAGTALVAAAGVGHMINKRGERQAMENLNQLEMAQAQQAAMAQAQANTYQASPAEVAAMEARFKQGGKNGGFAAGIQAERAAAASQTPAV